MLKFDIRNEGKKLSDAFKQSGTKAEEIIATQVMKDTEKYVPALTGSLSARTHIEGKQIVYPGPYARFLYYGKKMVESDTGRGPMRIPIKADGQPTGEYIFRFHKGATLVPTDEDLKFNKSMHPQATSHWFEVAKAMNLDKWLRIAERSFNAKHK